MLKLFVALFFMGVLALPASADPLCQVHGSSASNTATFWFDTRSPCAYSGMQVQQGRTYQVALQVPDKLRWSDKDIAANPGGFECELEFPQSWLMGLSSPLRRHTDQPWFQTMVRVGDNSYALPITSTDALPRDYCKTVNIDVWPQPWHCPPDTAGVEGGRTFNSTFTAQADGPLFFYVNDVGGGSVLGYLLYRNNQGCARVTISEKKP